MVEQTCVCVRKNACRHWDRNAMAWAADPGISSTQRNRVCVLACLITSVVRAGVHSYDSVGSHHKMPPCAPPGRCPCVDGQQGVVLLPLWNE